MLFGYVSVFHTALGHPSLVSAVCSVMKKECKRRNTDGECQKEEKENRNSAAKHRKAASSEVDTRVS